MTNINLKNVVKFVVISLLFVLSFVIKINNVKAVEVVKNGDENVINVGDTYNYSYLGNYELFEAPADGVYKMELWGASSIAGGKGGYVSGEMTLKKGQKFYVYVGNEGKTSSGGYNGGGSGRNYTTAGYYYGGGASDIRAFKEEPTTNDLKWDSDLGLKSRIIVAGGAGSAHGGGLSGYNGYATSYPNQTGYGGTQIAGGTVNNYSSCGSIYGTAGSFGKGGVGGSVSDSGGGYGGGGGWYGGSGSSKLCSGFFPSGGGSSYISGHAGAIGVTTSGSPITQKYNTISDSYSPTGFIFSNTKMIDGKGLKWTTSSGAKEQMPNPNGGYYSIDSGNSGDGAARITIVQVFNTNAKLEFLDVDGGEFNPSFSPDTKEYNVIVDSENYQSVITAIPQDETTTVSIYDVTDGKIITGDYDVKAGTHTVKITTTAESGNTLLYTLNITRVPSSYKYLNDIKIDGTTISGFEPTKLEYNIDVSYDTLELDLEYVKGRPSQTVMIPSDLTLGSGNNRIEIIVISEDGLSTLTYVINVNKEHSSKLKSLSFELYRLDPEFDPETLVYTVNVFSSTMSLPPIFEAYDDEATVKTSGFGYIRSTSTATITVTEPNSAPTVYKVIIVKEDEVTKLTYDFPYSGDYQVFIAPTTGSYKIELWGAAAENRGNGGYTSGTIYLEKDQKLYVYVGGEGKIYPVGIAGYNGGGYGRINTTAGYYYGGGATDIRVLPDNVTDSQLLWDSTLGLKSRIMVAGGAGSANAGGLYGYNGYSPNYPNQTGYGGSQIAGGTVNNYPSCGTIYGTYGSFGKGGNGGSVSERGGGNGGGGGWYGGTGSSKLCSGFFLSGGGSSYISGHAGSIAVTNEGLPKKQKYSELSDSYSPTGFIFTDTKMIDGGGYSWTTVQSTKEAMPNPLGGYYPLGSGRKGDGYARIIYLRPPSENNYLTYLKVFVNDEEKTYTPDFDMIADEQVYSLTLDSTETKANIKVKLEDNRATVDGDGEIEVLVGTNDYEVKVTAEAGNEKIYTVRITRPADENPYPDDIVISGLVPSLCSKDADIYCKVNPTKFDKDTHTYYLTVPSRIKQLWFDVDKGHPNQVVNGEGKVSLKNGVNDITITVTSEAGVYYGTNEPNSVYHYIVTRDMTGDNDLGKFHIWDPTYEINFEPDTLEYYMIVENRFDKWQVNDLDEKDINIENVLQMFFEVDDIDSETHVANATFIVNGPKDGGNNKILNTGMNDITITVTAANGEVKNYILHVYREQSKNTYISNIQVLHGADSYALAPQFYKGNTGIYQVRVPNEVADVDIIATPEASTTTVTVTTNGVICTGANCNNLLNTGNNRVLLSSVAENSGVIEIYTMNIYREKNGNDDLANLQLFVGTDEKQLNPYNDPFDTSILEYTASVPVGTTSVNIVATPEKETSQVKYLDNNTIKAGTNVKRVMVVAEDGSQKIYRINIERPADDNNYLKNLTISAGTLDPDNDPFDKTVEEYTVQVENNVTNLTVFGEKESNLAVVKGNGKYSLAVGDNIITIIVVAEDGSTRNYRLTVNRKPNTNPYLANITTSEGVILTNHDDLNYELNIGANVSKVTLNGIPEVKTTTVAPTKVEIQTLNYGVYTQTFTTLAEDGVSTLTYTLTINKEKSNNNFATNIIMEEGAIKPKFDKNVTTGYTVKVARTVESGTFHVTLEDPRSTYTITGNENFEIGDNTVTVTVKAEDGTTRDYVINVIRQELTSNYLIDIKIKGLISNTNYDLIPLNIPFDKTVQYYEVNVPYSESKINVSAILEDEDAEITGTGVYNLNVGDNLIVLEITSLDGKSRTYQVKVNRKASPDARLKEVSLEGSILLPSFNKDVFSYNVSTTDTSLVFKSIVPIEKDSTYEIIGNDFTTNEDHEVIIRVTAPDGETTQDYVFNVTKSASDNNNLDILRVVDYEIVPTYQKNKTVYTLTVPKEVNSVLIEAIPEHPLAIVDGDGTQSLEVGINNLVVEVTSESGKTKSYVIIVTREGDDNNELEKIIVRNGVMTPAFDGSSSYDVVVPYDETELDLEIILGADTQSYVVEGNNLEVGSNVVKVIVTAENGDKRTYTLNVTREEIVSALLKTLKFEGYELVPTFNGSITTYDLTIDYEVEDFIDKKDYTTADATNIAKKYMLVETLDKNATYAISGNTGLVVGGNTITVTVTASDNVTTETYTINVNKQVYSNSFLDYFYTSQGDVEPTFDRYIMEYTIEVPNSVEKIEFYGEPVDKSATVVGACDPDETTNGVPDSCNHSLKVGVNRIPVTVTTTSNIKRTYYINVTRKASDDNLLETLIVKADGEPKTLTPEFNKLTNDYTLEVPVGTEFINLSGTISPKATVKGLGDVKLVGGENTVKVVVTSESGVDNVYTIIVTRPKSDNNHLIELIPSIGYLEPDFSYEETNYTINLDSKAAFLGFDVVMEDPNASVVGDESLIVPDGTSIREIIVTAEDGTERKYTITINKERTDIATLSELYVVGYPFEEGIFAGVTYVATFDPDTYEYHITVPNNKIVLLPSEVVAKTTDKNAKITKSNTLDLLTTKENEFIVTVTAPDGFTKQDYKVVVTREKNNEALLSNLRVNVGYLTTTFNPNVTEYTWKVPKNSIITDASVTATASDPNAEIVKTSSLTLTVAGPNIYEVMVIAEDGSTSITYTLNVEIDLSVDATLANLVVNKGYYLPTFDPDIKRYDVYEYVDETDVTVIATPNSDTSNVISGNGLVQLPTEETYHKIIVEAEDGTTEEYELYIHKSIKRDEGLADLFLNGLEGLQCIDDKCILKPTFTSDVIEYSIKVPYEYTLLDVYYETMNNQQIVKLRVGNLEVENGKRELPVGKNEVLVDVYDGMGVLTRTYTLKVERCKSNNTYLKSLQIKGIELVDGEYPIYELDPEFDKKKLEYTIIVESDVEEVSIIAEPEDENAHAVPDGYNYLADGNNDATIEVIAPDGSTRTYIVHIIRTPKFNSYIKNITVSTGVFWELTPKFNPTVYEYKVTVPSYAEKATVEAVPVSANTDISGTGEYNLKTGINVVTLTSKSRDGGEESTYRVTIIREESTNVDIEQLIVEEGDLYPNFIGSKTNYEVNVPANVDKLTMHIVLADKTSTYQVFGNDHLITGDNVVSIVVTNSTKTAAKTYQIVVHKAKDTDNYLGSLKVYDDSKVYLDKTFSSSNPASLSYDITVPYNIDKVNILAVPSSITATIFGNGEEYLNYGNNEKTVTITSESGDINNYQINIYREYNLYLKNLINDIGTLDPVFDRENDTYTINLNNDQDRIVFIAQPESNKVTVDGSGEYNLNTGENVIRFTVKDPDNHTKIYTVNVIRAKDDNNYLSDLQIAGILTPSFVKTNQEYTVDVRKEVTEITDEVLTSVVPESSTATYVVKNRTLSSNLDEESIVTITVTSESGLERDYVLKVTRRPDEFFSNRLLSIIVKNGTEIVRYNPDFEKNINNYAATVANSVSEVTIEVTKENERAVVVGDGNHTLQLGRNVIEIQVTSNDGTGEVTNVYSMVIYREENADATLKSLTIKNFNYTPLFEPLRENYELEIDGETDSLEIIAVPTDPNSKVTISGNNFLVMGENTVTIHVVAPDNVTTKDYTIKVTKTASKNNFLKSLEVAGNTIAPDFNKLNQGPYTVNVENTVNSILINAEPESTKATLTGDGTHNLITGRNVIEVKVTAEDGTPRTYTVIVNKAASSDATLRDLIVSDGDLDPVFNPSILNYEVLVPEDLEDIVVTGIVNDPAATVSGNGTYDLEDAETEIKITVTAEDGNKTTYTVKVIKDIKSSSKLKKLVVRDGELYPRFHKLITSYTVLVPNEIRSLNMTYEPEDPEATVEVIDNERFKVGSNKVIIRVTSKDGESTTDYEINVVRQVAASNYLINLEVEGYTLNPVFNKSTMYYEVTVPMDVDQVKIKATLEDETATVSGTGFKYVNPGSNLFYVTVESATGVIRSYQIVINRTQSSENKLLTLTYDVGTINPEFNPDVNSYVITVPEKTKEITLDGTASENSTVIGLGKSEVKVGDQTRVISVTSQGGDTNTYSVIIRRPASTNTNLLDLVPSAGTLTYDNDTTEYTFEVDDNVTVISFTATPEDEDATVTGIDLTTLDYGENEITIVVTAEDGETTREITVKVVKNKDLISIEVSETDILLEVTEEKEITYTLNPADTSYPEVQWISKDESVATVDQNGKITGVGIGATQVQVVSTHDNTIYATVNVNVINKKIVLTDESSYTIVRKENDEDTETVEHVIGLEASTKLSDFIANFKNNPLTLHVYDKNGMELTDPDQSIATFMMIKLVIDEKVYDELEIVVRGDLNGDSYITVTDLVKLQNNLLNKVDFDYIENQAAEMSGDGFVTVTDLVKLQNYLLNKISTVN